MGKREKKAKPPVVDGDRRGRSDLSSIEARPHLPKKRPVMLAISVVLFALWFVFLLVTAVFG